MKALGHIRRFVSEVPQRTRRVIDRFKGALRSEERDPLSPARHCSLASNGATASKGQEILSEEIATEALFNDGGKPCSEKKDNAKFETQCGPNSCLHQEGMPVEEIAAEDQENGSRPCYKEEKGNEIQCGPDFCLPQEGMPIDALQENGTISKQSMLKLYPGESSFPDFHPCDFKQPPPPYVELDFACEVASNRPQGAAYLGGVELSDHVLGQGSYGAVIAATHWNLKVAAKSMHPFLQVSPRSIQQFENECETLRNITHPNIVQFMGIYKPDDDTSTPYLIMELMKGGSLNQLVDSLQEGLRAISLQQKINIMLDIALALSYLHNERKITHRDLSSSNVLLTEDLKAKVSDLGMSRPFTIPYNQPSTLAPGCLSYMPPESLVQGSRFSPPGDNFSFAVISIELTIEEHPRPRAVRVSEVERRKRDLLEFERKAPDSLRDIVIPCLTDNPEERPTSNDIASRLQNLMNSCDCASGESSVKRYNSNPGISQPHQVSNQQDVASPLFPSSAQGSFLHAEDVPFSTSESQQETMPFAAEVGTGNLLEQIAPPLTSNSTQGPYVYGNQIITSLPIPTHQSEEESSAEESEQHSVMQESQRDVGKLVAGVFGSNANEATVEEDEESDFKDSVEEEDEESDCKDSCTASDSQDTSKSYDHFFLSAVSEQTTLHSEQTTLHSEQCSKKLYCQHLPTENAPMKLRYRLLTEYPQLSQGNFTNFQCQATHLNSVVSFPLALNSRCSKIKQVSRFSEYPNVHSWILDVMMKRSIANATLCVNNFKMFMNLHVSEAVFKLVEQMSYVFQHVQCFNSQPSEPLLDKNKTSTVIPMVNPPFSCENSNGHPTSASLCSTVIAKSSTTPNFHSKTYFSAVLATLALYSNGVITSAYFCSTLVSKKAMTHTFQDKGIILAIFEAKIVLYSHSVCLLLKAVLFMTSASRFGYILVEQVLWYLACVIPLLDEQLFHENVTSAIDYGTKCSMNEHLHSLICRSSLTSEDHIVSVHRVCLMAKLKLFLFFSQGTPCLCTSTLSTSLKGSPSCADKINVGLSAVSVSEVSILQPNRSKTSCHDCPLLSHTPSPVGLDGFTDSHRIHIAKRKLYWLIYSLTHHQTTFRFSSPSHESTISLALQGPSRFNVSPLNLKQLNLNLNGPCTFDVSEAPLSNFKQPGKVQRSYLDFSVLTHIYFPDCQLLIPHYLHSHHIEGGDQITGMHRVHLIAMLKLYWSFNLSPYHQSTFCFNKVPSCLALQGTEFSISPSANWNWPQNSHYKTIGDQIMGMHTMYLIAELCSLPHNRTTSHSAFSPSHKSMVNLALQGSSLVNVSHLSLPHMPMTQFLNSLITGNMVDVMLQMQWSDSSLTFSAPTHSHSPVFISLMWSLKLHRLQSCHSTSGDQITSVCGVLIAKLIASWINTSSSCESKINLAVEALSHPSLKESICRASYSRQLHGTVLQSNKGSCNDKTLQIRCNDVSTMIHTHLFTCSKLLIELIGSKTLWYLMVYCLYSPHNTSGEQIMCVRRVHLIGNLKLCRPSCSPSALIGSELPLTDLEQAICIIGNLKLRRLSCSSSHCQTTFHFDACSSYMKKMNLALQETSALIGSELPLTDLEQAICVIGSLKLCRLSCSCQTSSHFDVCSLYRNKMNLALQEPSALLESQPPFADLEQSICSVLHLPHFHGTSLHAKCDSEQCRGSSNDQINSGLHQGRIAFGVKVLMSTLSSANESKNTYLCSSGCSLVKSVHLSSRFLITEARTKVGFDLSTFSYFLLVGSKVLQSTTWHNAKGDQMTSTLIFEHCEMYLFTKPFWLASISGYHKASASFLFQPCIPNACSYTRKSLALQRPNTLSILHTPFLDLTHQEIKVISSPQSDKSSQNTGGCCGKEGSDKKDKDSSGGDKPQDTGSGRGPPGSGDGDGDENDKNSGKKELQFEESEGKSSEEENDTHSDERHSQRPRSKLWNVGSLPSLGRSGSLVTPCLQSKLLFLLSGAYMLLQYKQKTMTRKLERFDTVIVHMPLKGCRLLSTSCTCVLVVCNDSLCIHLYETNMHLCLRITLHFTKWKEKSLKPNPSIMCEGASSYTGEKWVYL